MLPLFLAFRLSASSDGRRSSPAVKVAVAAVALSVGVMLAAVAIVLGFKSEITKKVLGFNPDIVLRANMVQPDASPIVKLSPQIADILNNLPYVESYSLSASSPAIFKPAGDFKGVYAKSLDDGKMKEFIQSQLIAGSVPDFANDESSVVISNLASKQLNISAGDTLPTYFITNQVFVRPLRVAGIYDSHFDAYDDIFAFTNLKLVQEIGGIKQNEGTYINIYVDDFDNVREYVADLRDILFQAYSSGAINTLYEVDSALSAGANFFSWLQLLDTNAIVILVLMTIVAAITLISGMMIIIVDKTRFIAVMKSMGAENGTLRRTFIWLTIRIAITGLLIGNILMLVLLLFQDYYHFIPLDPENYYINFVPVIVDWRYVLILNASVLAVTYLLLALPSRFVSTISPAKSLQKE